MNKLLILSVVLFLVGSGLGFLVGSRFQRRPSNSDFIFRQRLGNNMNSVRGQIVRDENGSLTIKLSDGTTRLVIVPSSATIYKTATASASDLKANEEVMVIGTENSDGSITAENIQLNPRERFMSPTPGR